MAKTVKEYRLFFAFPSDITDEYEIVSTVIDEWNIQHGDTFQARLQMTSWKTHSFPSVDGRPQKIINRQVVDDADIVVGVFWSKFGSPTGEAESGTEEEIRRGISAGKKVMLYFSDRALPPSKFNPAQMEKIASFKNDFKDRGLYFSFSSTEEFTSLFRQHLAAVMREQLHAPEPLEPTLEPGDPNDIAITVELGSRYWMPILIMLDKQIKQIPRMAKEIALHKKPDEFDDAERAILVGPIVARAKIVDAFVNKGLMTQEAKTELGLQALLKIINEKEIKQA